MSCVNLTMCQFFVLVIWTDLEETTSGVPCYVCLSFQWPRASTIQGGDCCNIPCRSVRGHFWCGGGGREAVMECLTIPPNNQNLARKWDDESEVCLVRNRQMSMRAT